MPVQGTGWVCEGWGGDMVGTMPVQRARWVCEGGHEEGTVPGREPQWRCRGGQGGHGRGRGVAPHRPPPPHPAPPPLPCHTPPRPATPCHAPPCHAPPCHATPCHALPRPVPPCHALPHPATPCHTLPRPAPQGGAALPAGVVGAPHVRPLQLRRHQRLRPRLQRDDGRVPLQGVSPSPSPTPPGTPGHPQTVSHPPPLPQENHYRPPGSDSCLLCDCYPTGSLSRLCHRTSGQCPCKAGVIGRHCDRCDNPFAEVTAGGCEGGGRGGVTPAVTLCHPV